MLAKGFGFKSGYMIDIGGHILLVMHRVSN
jgi:hypothetical protein